MDILTILILPIYEHRISFIYFCLLQFHSSMFYSFLFLIALLYREVTDFRILILYTETSLNFQICSNSFLVESLEFSIHNIWRRKWQPTPVFLPGEYHGQKNMVDYNPWVCTELETTEATKQHTKYHTIWNRDSFNFSFPIWIPFIFVA